MPPTPSNPPIPIPVPWATIPLLPMPVRFPRPEHSVRMLRQNPCLVVLVPVVSSFFTSMPVRGATTNAQAAPWSLSHP